MDAQRIAHRALVVVGAGAVARQVRALVADLGTDLYRIVGYLDTQASPHSRLCGPLLGADDMLATVDAAYVIAVGNPFVRRRVAASATEWGRHAVTLVHPSATVDDGATLGAGAIVFPGARIQADAHLGRHVLVNSNAVIGHDCAIAPHVVLSPLSMIGGGVVIEDGAFVGAGAIVLPHRVIGSGATIGAGAVVTADVPREARVAGVPARRIAGA